MRHIPSLSFITRYRRNNKCRAATKVSAVIIVVIKRLLVHEVAVRVIRFREIRNTRTAFRRVILEFTPRSVSRGNSRNLTAPRETGAANLSRSLASAIVGIRPERRAGRVERSRTRPAKIPRRVNISRRTRDSKWQIAAGIPCAT